MVSNIRMSELADRPEWSVRLSARDIYVFCVDISIGVNLHEQLSLVKYGF